MKKWTLQIIACSVNAMCITGVLLLFLHNVIVDTEDFMKDEFMPLIIFLLVYLIYMLADYWGIKLVNRYDKREPISLSNKRSIIAILVFHCVAQLGVGLLVSEIVRIFFAGVNNGLSSRMNFYGLMDLLIIMSFITGLIIFPSTIILLRAVRKKNLELKNEIDKLGINTSEKE